MLNNLKINILLFFGLYSWYCERVLSKVNDTESDIKAQIELGLVKSDLEPIRCTCGCKEFVNPIIATEGYLVVEKQIACKKCNKICGYWSYGHYIP